MNHLFKIHKCSVNQNLQGYLHKNIAVSVDVRPLYNIDSFGKMENVMAEECSCHWDAFGIQKHIDKAFGIGKNSDAGKLLLLDCFETVQNNLLHPATIGLSLVSVSKNLVIGAITVEVERSRAIELVNGRGDPKRSIRKVKMFYLTFLRLTIL